MFDAFDSDFWITGNTILKAKAKENGWMVLENISNFDQNKQNEQVKAMVDRKVDGIMFIPTDNNAVIPAIRAANAANIPIMLFNRPPAQNDNKYVAIQADNRNIMRHTVRYWWRRESRRQVQGLHPDRRSGRQERHPAPRRALESR